MIYALIAFHTDTIRKLQVLHIMTVQSWPMIYFLKSCLVLIVQSIVNAEVNPVEEEKF